jgi:uncharacterized Zn finger protein
MKCPICGKDVQKLTLRDRGQGLRLECDDCKKLSKEEQYDLLQGRLEESLTAARALCSEGYKAGDQETVWTAKAVIKELERQKARMWVPEGRR